jgi:hypothetical protein
MFITGLDGRTIEAVIYSQTSTTMRVALNDADDLVDFTCISGQWVSENCEPVSVEFAWQRIRAKELVSEGDCICSEGLASQLVQSLWRGGSGGTVKVSAIGSSAG